MIPIRYLRYTGQLVPRGDFYLPTCMASKVLYTKAESYERRAIFIVDVRYIDLLQLTS